jgi:hypothetical protein
MLKRSVFDLLQDNFTSVPHLKQKMKVLDYPSLRFTQSQSTLKSNTKTYKDKDIIWMFIKQ